MSLINPVLKVLDEVIDDPTNPFNLVQREELHSIIEKSRKLSFAPWRARKSLIEHRKNIEEYETKFKEWGGNAERLIARIDDLDKVKKLIKKVKR